MLRYMLDTDTCIYVIKNRPTGMHERFNRHSGELCLSTVTLGELVFGAENSTRPDDNLAVVESFIARLRVLDFDQVAARHFGEIRAVLKRRGRPIGSFDQMIAAHARSAGLTLVSNNTREFERVDGLLLENWVTAG